MVASQFNNLHFSTITKIKKLAINASKAGSHQAKHDYFIGRSRYKSSAPIKSNNRKIHKNKK